MNTETINLDDAIDQAINSGVNIGGWTVRMTCDDPRFRDPRGELQVRVLSMFGELMTDNRFEVIDVPDRGLFAVFDGYHLCQTTELKDAITGFDNALNEILDDFPREDGDRNKVGLNIGFLADAHDIGDGHVHGPDCDH